jgi:hypothetical protein
MTSKWAQVSQCFLAYLYKTVSPWIVFVFVPRAPDGCSLQLHEGRHSWTQSAPATHVKSWQKVQPCKCKKCEYECIWILNLSTFTCVHLILHLVSCWQILAPRVRKISQDEDLPTFKQRLEYVNTYILIHKYVFLSCSTIVIYVSRIRAQPFNSFHGISWHLVKSRAFGISCPRAKTPVEITHGLVRRHLTSVTDPQRGEISMFTCRYSFK